MNKAFDAVVLLGRLSLSNIFIITGLDKLNKYDSTQGYMEAAGVPGGILPMVIFLELLGGVAIAFGIFTRTASILLAFFTLIAGFVFHYQPTEYMQMLMLMKNVSIFGGFLILMATGPGSFSFDARFSKK